MEKRIVIPRIVVRPILPPPLEVGARIRPQWLHWQVGRYREKLSFGPGGEGKAKIWVPEIEGEQHNMILNQFYDSLIPQYGMVGSSLYAAVGTGSTAPDPTQTQLANEIGTSSSPRRTSSPPPGQHHQVEALATPGEYNVLRVHEFPETWVGGLNLTEWGYSPLSSRNGALMTRELFRDSNGNPIVLTLAADQSLRLIYRYKVTVSPTSPQAVSVNIGGDGPGVRTAQFMLTGVVSNDSYWGCRLPSPQRGGDLIVADVLARGTRAFGSSGGVGTVAFSNQAAPLTYILSGHSFPTTFAGKPLSYNAPVGRSRKASALLEASENATTIRSVILNGNLYSSGTVLPTGNLVFDNGQEFTKDNLHRLFVGYWQVTWGP
jgi:hypothetical protein